MTNSPFVRLAGPVATGRLLPLGAAILLLAVPSACSRQPQPRPQAPIPVKVAQVLVRDFPVYETAVGTTEAMANVEIRARVAATVLTINYAEGSEVHKGDLLFTLDKSDISQALDAAREKLAQLQVALTRAEADAARAETLSKQNVITQQDLEQARANLDTARAAFRAGESAVKSAEIDLGYCDVYSPLDGYAGAKQVDVGTLAGVGTPTLLTTISPFDPMGVRVELSEVVYLNAIAQLRAPGDQHILTLQLANGALHPYSGKLRYIDRAVNPATGTITVRLEYPNPDHLIRPGQFCRVIVRTNVIKDGILIPQRAVQEIQGVRNVFVVNASGVVAYRAIETGARAGSLWLVTSGLQAGETVVVEGVGNVRDGAQVASEPVVVDASALKGLDAYSPSVAP